MPQFEPVIDGASCAYGQSHRVLRHVDVGLGPEGLAVDSAGRHAYVACSRSNAVTMIGLDGDPACKNFQVGNEPIPIIFDEPSQRVFTADARSDTVSVLDATGRSLDRVRTGRYPAGLGYHPGLRRLYCGNTASGTVTVIDIDTLRTVGTVQAGLGAGSIAIDAEEGRGYVADFMASTVTVFDLVTLRHLGRISVPPGPCKVVLNSATRHAHVACSLDGLITTVSLESGAVVGETPVERAPVGMCVAPDGRWLYVCNRGAGTVSVLDARSGGETHRITVGAAPGDCAIDPASGRLLVSNAGSGTVSVVDRPWLAPPAASLAAHPAVGRRLPDFELPDLRTGRLRRSREWAEKRYLLCFFASW